MFEQASKLYLIGSQEGGKKISPRRDATERSWYRADTASVGAYIDGGALCAGIGVRRGRWRTARENSFSIFPRPFAQLRNC